MAQLQRVAIAPGQKAAERIVLTADQQHYLGRVLRLRAGDRFIAMDGQGQGWLAQLTAVPAEAQVLEAIATQTELPVAVTLAVAMPKTGMDDIVRQSTELGVACIAPILSDRTLLKPSPQKLERWRKIAQEAAEQSERQIIPTILEPQSFPASLQTWTDASAHFIGVARGKTPTLWSYLLSQTALPASLVMLTGPEGGWTSQEVEQAIAAGYRAVSLGKRILRATTAPVAAMSWVGAIAESRTDAESGL